MIEIPDEAGCRELMTRYSMLPNILEHSYRVCQLACFLARALNRIGGNLNPELISAASLLHDITKTRSLRTRENHADSARDLLRELGCPEVAEIVGRHIRVDPCEASLPLCDAHIVNYADKRVRHTLVVSLKDRFEDLAVRYGVSPGSQERIEKLKEGVFMLETRIFQGLCFRPGDLESFNALPVFDLNTVPPPLLRCRSRRSPP
jgi:uncharacterized protein